MAGDASRTIVPFDGALFVAPVGTPTPSDIDSALNTAFTDVGFLAQHPSWGKSESFTDIRAAMHPYVIRKVPAGDARFFVRAELDEWSDENLEMALGVSVTSTTNGVKLTPVLGQVQRVAAVLEWSDPEGNSGAGANFRLVVPVASVVTDNFEVTLDNTGIATIPLVLEATPSGTGDPWYGLTDLSSIES